MEFYISNSSDKPIYEQIMTQIKSQILSGALKEGDALPSIRVLARELRISVITTKRAYDELEHAGLLHSVAGKGTFVAAADPQLLREEKMRQLEDLESGLSRGDYPNYIFFECVNYPLSICSDGRQ